MTIANYIYVGDSWKKMALYIKKIAIIITAMNLSQTVISYVYKQQNNWKDAAEGKYEAGPFKNVKVHLLWGYN